MFVDELTESSFLFSIFLGFLDLFVFLLFVFCIARIVFLTKNNHLKSNYLQFSNKNEKKKNLRGGGRGAVVG